MSDTIIAAVVAGLISLIGSIATIFIARSQIILAIKKDNATKEWVANQKLIQFMESCELVRIKLKAIREFTSEFRPSDAGSDAMAIALHNELSECLNSMDAAWASAKSMLHLLSLDGAWVEMYRAIRHELHHQISYIQNLLRALPTRQGEYTKISKDIIEVCMRASDTLDHMIDSAATASRKSTSRALAINRSPHLPR